MVSLENRLAATVLEAIRSHKSPGANSVPRTMLAGAPAKLREATFADFDAVMDLRRAVGWSVDTIENWERLWQKNPALPCFSSAPPIGWVLEAQGRVVGYLGNIPSMYRLGDRVLTSVTGSGLVVQPAYRAAVLSLNAAFYGQKNVDLFLSTTAIEAVGKIARAFKAAPLPQTDYDTVLFWALQPAAFSAFVMKKLGLGHSFSRIAGLGASLAVRADRLLRRRAPKQSSSGITIEQIAVSDIGDEFGALWETKLKERQRLLADRSPGTLRWHFEIPGDRGATEVLCCRKNQVLQGYAVVRHEVGNESGLRRSIIADSLVKDDDPEVLAELWFAAYKGAKKAGSHTFEVLGFPANVRQICARWHPYTRKYPACPFFYKAADGDLHRTLADESLWYASPFDGDTTLWGFGS